MNVVPGVHTSLISTCKMADAGYITVLDKQGLKIYDGTTCKIMASECSRCTYGVRKCALEFKERNF